MSQPKVKRQKIKYDPEEEARLERQVFGDAKDVIEHLTKKDANDVKLEDEEFSESDDEKEDSNDEDDSSNTYDDNEDKEKDDSDNDDDDDNDASEKQSEGDSFESASNSVKFEESDEEELRDAWCDEADEEYSIKKALKIQERRLPKGRPEKNYKELLEKKFRQLVGTPKWAEIQPKNEDQLEDDEDKILRHSNHLASVEQRHLPANLISLKVLRDINMYSRNEGPVITSVQFHPTSTVALVAGLAGVLSICQVDGRQNTKLQSIKFENFKINAAKFLNEGNEVLAGSRTRTYSQSYDLITGKTYKIPLPDTITNMQNFEVSPDGKKIAVIGRKWGEIFLLTASGKELIHTFKMHKKCRTLAFTPDNKYLITHGDSEEIYVWDLNDRRCVHKAIDDGCLASGAVAISPSGQFFATGSKQGAVNIYEMKSILSERIPQPCKIILNLVTPISDLKFNPTSEILAMSSSVKENAFRMVHFPSMHVFSNFPTFGTVMHHPQMIDFSPSSGFMSVTNDKNNAFLYRLKHYGNY